MPSLDPGTIPHEVYWLNGRLRPPEDAVVSVNDFGFLYGEGLFETMRSRNGRIAYLDRHLHRLTHSAERVDLPLPDESLLRWGLAETLESLGEGEGRMRLTVTRGSAGAFDAPSPVPPTLLVTGRSALPPPAAWRALWSPIRRDEAHPLARVKSGNYWVNLMARREARSRGADEALFLNRRGEVTEGSVSNLFLLSDGVLTTPPVEAGLLPGILRSVLLDRAGEIGLEAEVRTVAPEDLYRSEGALLTNAVVGVVPLLSIDEEDLSPVNEGVLLELRSLIWREADFQRP